ncbi:hypothetical protein [Paracoccus aerodenitrificans]|uniref:hypothetical protein n=1 Tax=Paracoccus aerodenitrificans TaxID=3017781 RepID=UPI0022F10DD2|nr:hypothetical protein [Paracoccus aerodenitrificans]WBU62655.1 hypothetical protein PAE61_09705 [Paracoccus aerodenitrificans]
MILIDPKLIFPALLLAAGLAVTVASAQQAPLSANDWLRGEGNPPGYSSAWRPGDPVPRDASRRRPAPAPVKRVEPPDDIATSAATVPVDVRRLGAANPDGAGIISARQAGLPDDFWRGTDLDTALRMIRAQPRIPASAQIARRVLEAQLAPPALSGDHQTGAFFLARVDELISQGALPSARDLLQATGTETSESFRRLFDLSLLLGGDSQLCTRMEAAPGIITDPAARIFCMAQNGDWSGAALVLIGAGRLKMIDPQMADLLTHYLDDAGAETAGEIAVTDPMTPLAFRLHEAIGRPLPTGDLDLAYAWSDLDDHAGWKAQLEAAERLARARALPAQSLHQLYTAQRPAASGGVWERAAAIQALDAALATGDPQRIGPALVTAFRRMEHAGMRDAFAMMAAPQLQPGMLQGNAARLALWLKLWIGDTEVTRAPENQLDIALLALASGGQPEPVSAALGALAPVFAADLPPAPDPGDDIALAPALFGALADADAGIQGDVTRAARGVQTLRQLGLIADARRVATQIALDPLLKEAAQ